MVRCDGEYCIGLGEVGGAHELGISVSVLLCRFVFTRAHRFHEGAIHTRVQQGPLFDFGCKAGGSRRRAHRRACAFGCRNGSIRGEPRKLDDSGRSPVSCSDQANGAAGFRADWQIRWLLIHQHETASLPHACSQHSDCLCGTATNRGQRAHGCSNQPGWISRVCTGGPNAAPANPAETDS